MVTGEKRRAPRAPREADIQSAILQALHYRREVDVWRSNTGAARLPGKGGKIRPVFFGLLGSADITGLIRPWGVRLEIEVKRPGNKQRDAQEAFEARIKRCGGIYLLVHSVDECMRLLDVALAEIRKREAV